MAIVSMVVQLARNWGWIVLRGITAILFGVLAFVWPGRTLAVLVLLFGAYAFVSGLLALVAGFRIKDAGRPMWPLVIIGLISLGAAIATFVRPGMTALVLLSFIAGWALLTGTFEIAAAIRLRRVIANEWMMGLSGLLSIAFGALMLARPGAGALAVVWIIAWYAVLFGIALVMLGFRLKGVASHLPKPA
jgi:uncharacterized membrane protein HdeD (DUF308 family)